MAKDKKISNAVIKRLPRYRRYLQELDKRGVEKISSAELSKMIGYTASQIRQDLNNFGTYGQQGYGYNVKALCDEISTILGLNKTYHIVLVGAGNLGHAISNYMAGYNGFTIDAAFDVNPNVVGTQLEGIEVYHVDKIVDYVEKNKIDIGIVCTPKEVAQEVVDKLCFAGVKGIWEFAPTDVEVPPHVSLEYVHLSDSLYSLAYHMNRK